MLINENWDKVLQQTDVNKGFNIFLRTFLHNFETCFPMQYVINKTINNQWITAGIKVSCKCKKSLYIVSKTTNSPIINAFYTQYNIILQKVIRQVRHLYYSKLIRTPSNKNKTLWKITNKESGNSYGI